MNILPFSTESTSNNQIEHINGNKLLINDSEMPHTTSTSSVDASLTNLSASLTAAFVQQMSQNTKPLLYSFVTLEGNKIKTKFLLL
jgi:hypothetical protein